MVTISDVAEKAKVSRATVSHVINNTRYVSDETRHKVEKVISELGYRPNVLARSLRSGQTHTLGLIVPDSSNTFFAEISREIEISAFEAGYSVILCNSNEDPQREKLYIDVLTEKQVDGIILVSTCGQINTLRGLKKLQIPVALLDRDIKNLSLDTVLVDNKNGGLLATNHLISLGHQRIGFITGPSDANPSAERLTGYKQALRENGIPFEKELIRYGDFTAPSGRLKAIELISLSNPPTAIFAGNDMMAIGVLRAATEKGLHVPEDIALIGFDDIELAAFTNPPLTTIAQPKLEMGKTITELLIQRIKNKERDVQFKMLPVSLIIRETCGG